MSMSSRSSASAGSVQKFLNTSAAVPTSPDRALNAGQMQPSVLHAPVSDAQPAASSCTAAR